MHILLIDNYDSFTYNLAQYVRESALAPQLTILRNDAFELAELERYDAFILSPGPGVPSEAGYLLETIKTYADQKPILGICLGHQAIVEAFGGRLQQLEQVYHGLATPVKVVGTTSRLLEKLPEQFEVGRYHSWVAEQMPKNLRTMVVDEQDMIMGCEDVSRPIFGLQFHPESVLTPQGRQLMDNFLNICQETLEAKASISISTSI